MKKKDSYNKVFKGKSASTSVPVISMRYTADDEELHQFIENPSESSGINEGVSVSCSESPLMEKRGKEAGKLSKRSGSLEDPTPGETWKFFTEIKGRITKTVEEKIEEIKSDRMKKTEKKRKLITGGENSSISDSEDRSEASSSRQSPVKSESLKESEGESSDLSTPSLGRKNSVQLTEIDISDTTPVKEDTYGKGFSGPFRKHDKARHSRPKRKKRESVEIAEEALEEVSETKEVVIKSKITQLASRIKLWWPMVLVPLIGVTANSALLPSELFWLVLGIGLTIMFRFIYDWLMLFDTTVPEKSLFTGNFHLESVPIIAEKIQQLTNTSSQSEIHEGWLNEFEGEYNADTYKVSLTYVVYVKLEGSSLKLGTPRVKIPKRASWNEPEYSKELALERSYNIKSCSVTLLPKGLTRKRLWSKKYPIYIKLFPHSYIGTVYKDKDDVPDNDLTYSNPDLEQPNPEGKPDVVSEALPNEDEGTEVLEQNKEEEIMKPSEKVSNLYEEDEFDISDFVHVPAALVGKKTGLYLFARSDREKEIWFRRFVQAVSSSTDISEAEDQANQEVNELLFETRLNRTSLDSSYLDFMKTLALIIPKTVRKPKWKNKETHSGSMWFNVFISRVLFDTLNDPFWVSKIQDKVQKKLSTVKLPSIIEELIVSKLEISGPGPVVEGWTEPRMDIDGLWTDLDISYKGQFSMTVDIKLNLVKKKINPTDIELTQLSSPEKNSDSHKSAIYNSSVEDSGESSSDELDKTKLCETPSPHSPQKHRNVVERIASSKYFLQVADSKLVKKALEGVSNTHISLIVEVKGLVGTVVINIPPPPSDRLWYGFRPKPKLWLSARPVLGDRVVNLVNITKWIEKRLYKEFEKILVMPNMDDLVIPIMNKNIPF